MNSQMLSLILYEISMSIGDTLDMKKMLDKTSNTMLSRLSCSSFAIYKEGDSILEPLYAKPKVLVKNSNYLKHIELLLIKCNQQNERLLSQEALGIHYYIFELKNFGYLILTKSDGKLHKILLRALSKINLKLVNAIFSSIDHKNLKSLQIKLSLQYDFLQSVLNATPDLIFYKDYKNNDGHYIGCNHAFELFAGKSASEIISYNDIEIFGEEVGSGFRKNDAKMLKIQEARINEEWVIYPDGKEVLLSTLKTPFYTHNRELLGVLGISRNITDKFYAEQHLKEQKNILAHQAHHDYLTLLPNRALFKDRLQHAIAKAKRTNTEFALFFIDLDLFKEINDTHGHDIGDKVLQMTANRLKSALREEDTLARLGGDEFTIILEHLTDIKNASLLAKKTIEIMQQPMLIDTYQLIVTCSLGISIYPHDAVTETKLLKYADLAMYHAKKKGSNTFEYYANSSGSEK